VAEASLLFGLHIGPSSKSLDPNIVLREYVLMYVCFLEMSSFQVEVPSIISFFSHIPHPSFRFKVIPLFFLQSPCEFARFSGPTGIPLYQHHNNPLCCFAIIFLPSSTPPPPNPLSCRLSMPYGRLFLRSLLFSDSTLRALSFCRDSSLSELSLLYL